MPKHPGHELFAQLMFGGSGPDSDCGDGFVVLMDHVESFGQVLLYGTDAESVLVDILSRR